jgi:cytochrome c-type biogenesis protein CcmF
MGRPLSVGAPFFNLAFGPLAGVLLAAAPIGTLLAWRKGDLSGALRALLWAALAGLAAAAAGVAFNAGIGPALGLGLGAYMLVGAGAYLWRRAGAGLGRWRRLLVLPAAVWAVALAHAGVGVLTIGAVAQTSLRLEHTGAMAVGESQRFAGRTVTLQLVQPSPGGNYDALQARFLVEQDGRTRVLRPERRTYISSSSSTTEVAIATGWLGDFYVALGEPALDQEGVARFGVRLYFNPFVTWMFAGAAMIALGGVLALGALAARARAGARASAEPRAASAAAPALTPAE